MVLMKKHIVKSYMTKSYDDLYLEYSQIRGPKEGKLQFKQFYDTVSARLEILNNRLFQILDRDNFYIFASELVGIPETIIEEDPGVCGEPFWRLLMDITEREVKETVIYIDCATTKYKPFRDTKIPFGESTNAVYMLTIGRKNGITNREEPLATLLTNDISAKSLKEFFIAVKEKIVFRDKQLLVVTNGMAAISTNIKYLSADAQEVYSTTHMKQLLEHTANKSSKSNQRALDQIVKQIIEVAEADTKHDADTRWAQLLEQQHEKAYLKNLWNLRSRWCRSYIGNHSKQLDLSNAIVTCIHRKIEARRWFEWEHVYYLLKHMSQTYEEYAKTKSDIINKIVPRFVTITEYQQIQDINQNIIGLMQDPDINGDTYTVEDKENLYFVKFDSDDITCTCQKFHDTQSWCNHIVRVIYPENDNAKLSIRALDSDLAEPEYYSCVEYDSIFHYLNPYIDRLNKYKNEIKLLKEYYREKSEYLDRIQETRHLKRIFSEETQFLMKEIAQKKKEQNNISDPRSLIKRSRYYEDPHFSEEYPFF